MNSRRYDFLENSYEKNCPKFFNWNKNIELKMRIQNPFKRLKWSFSVKILNIWKPLNIFAESLIVDVWLLNTSLSLILNKTGIFFSSFSLQQMLPWQRYQSSKHILQDLFLGIFRQSFLRLWLAEKIYRF